MKFDDLIETIDQLDAEGIKEVVDWQLTGSPAALAQQEFAESLSFYEYHQGDIRRPDQWDIDGWSGRANIQSNRLYLSNPAPVVRQELSWGQDFCLLDPRWRIEDPLTDDRPWAPIPVITLRLSTLPCDPGMYGWELRWTHPDGTLDGLQVRLAEHVLRDFLYSTEVARKPIFPGAEADAVLMLDRGDIRAVLEMRG